ncbi:galectin-9B isoform X1 [Protobothrops mucrosquamatus]|uniref:galectin-9B isoform X1 n=1 Tax=Protobothrops mucrosquamatus TaxID=103944 RepID=UPI000775B913|nr:galectin-9B isoform X1 [Protobothrops mucrosquamatus]
MWLTSVPFSGPIYGGLKDGMTILVSGSVLKSCKRFQVDFQCGSCQMPRSDVAFHFNVRFDENCAVCNSHEKGGWQQEERKYDMVFRKGHPFEIRFLVKINSYVVLVDGKQYLEFKHRIPLSRVDTIGISGELDVVSISFQGPIPNAYPIGQCFQQQIYPLPYRATIYGGLFPSKSIIISGSVSPSAQRFHINLKAGNDTAFHLNPRFDENVIVRNSNLNMRWGSEERHLPCGMPLLRGQPFTIWIQCEAHCFKVAVNGQHQFEYNHRTHNLLQINLLEVDGDIMVTNIQA